MFAGVAAPPQTLTRLRCKNVAEGCPQTSAGASPHSPLEAPAPRPPQLPATFLRRSPSGVWGGVSTAALPHPLAPFLATALQDATEFLTSVLNALPDDVMAVFKFRRVTCFERCSNRDCKTPNRRPEESDEYIQKLYCTNGEQQFDSLVDFQNPRLAECECGLGNFEENYSFNFDQPMKFLILQLQKMGPDMQKMAKRKINGFRSEKVEFRFRNSFANNRNEFQRFRTVALVKHKGQFVRRGHYQCYRKSEKKSGWIKLDDLNSRPEAVSQCQKQLTDVCLLFLEKG